MFVLSIAVVFAGSVFLFFSTPFSLSVPEAKRSVLLLGLGLWTLGPLLMAVLVPEPSRLRKNEEFSIQSDIVE
jgi:hypothetical protein